MLFDELEDYVKSSRLYAESAEVRERVSELRDRKRKHNYIKIYAKRLEIIHTIIMNDLMNENEKLKIEMQQKLQSFTEHANIGGKWSGMQKRRILSAYPNLKARAQFYLEQKQNKL